MIADVQRIPIASREEWLKLRLQDVTASDVAALFGKSPYKTMLGLFAEKAGLIAPDVEENDDMIRGRYMEHALLAAAADHPLLTDRGFEKCSHYYRSPSWRIGATPDAAVIEAGGNRLEPVDTKSVRSFVFDSQWADGVPMHIQLQVLVQAMLIDAPRGWVACGVDTQFPLHVFEVPRHGKAEQTIRDAVDAFWKAVDVGVPPEPCAGDHDTLAALFPRADRPEPLDWANDTEVLTLLDRRAEIGDIVKPLEGEKAEIDAKIKARMGAHGLALAPGWRVTWSEAFRPEKLQPASTYRVLRVKALTPDQEEMAA